MRFEILCTFQGPHLKTTKRFLFLSNLPYSKHFVNKTCLKYLAQSDGA